MILELKTLRVTCDRCGKTKVYSSTTVYLPPDGWKTIQIGPCGMTDYYRVGHLCPSCAQEDEST